MTTVVRIGYGHIEGKEKGVMDMDNSLVIAGGRWIYGD